MIFADTILLLVIKYSNWQSDALFHFHQQKPF